MNEQWVDYYKALELEFGCTEEEIKKAHRTLSKKYHPDMNGEEADEGKFKEVSEAYSVLGDPEKRAKYDETYLQHKNGEFQEEQTNEMPKYTHEEMHEAFTEEEIRFAKRVALQQTISETLENAKIIIDAKNELLFAAFNDAYDEESYRDEYMQFCAITNDFISNLNDLIYEAQEYGLDSEINTINQVIDFLGEVMESIPATLKEAKRKVKLEIMKEQLQNEAEQAISNAEAVREEFISLYSKTYRENISKDDFKMYYRILRLGVTDALSQLTSIYDLLKKAELDETYKNVGVLIGKLNQDLKLYTGKYKVAQIIGKREDLKMRIKNSMLSFTEYKVKMLDIMQGIIDDPTIDNAKLLVTKGKALTNDFHTRFNTIDKKDFEDTTFSDSAKELFKDALKIYNERNKLHEKLSKIFDKTEKTSISGDQVEFLTENVEMAKEEVEAIRLLREVYILLGQHNEYQEITRDDIKKLIKQVNGCIDKSDDLQMYLERMLEYLENTIDAYNSFVENGSVKDLFKGLDEDDLMERMESCQSAAAVFRLLSNVSVFAMMGLSFILGDSEAVRQFQIGANSLSMSECLFRGIVLSTGSYIPLRVIASSLSTKGSILGEKILLYRQVNSFERKYDRLVNGRDSYLDNIYQKAKSI